eukprot:gnl/Trimastix_PCT/2312.p1 GENE.gnl/Trimastix_PCT/2312~~gnl/Trimastix_PCT/2312.p1  ORF type:complete len:162 (-),score=29.67 gnl/Trimastix_PCT/2312:76-507(-)
MAKRLGKLIDVTSAESYKPFTGFMPSDSESVYIIEDDPTRTNLFVTKMHMGGINVSMRFNQHSLNFMKNDENDGFEFQRLSFDDEDLYSKEDDFVSLDNRVHDHPSMNWAHYLLQDIGIPDNKEGWTRLVTFIGVPDLALLWK